jgi:hypothetical protein
VPNQTLAALNGSLISAAHFPHGLCLTPLYLLLGSAVRISLLYSYVGDNVICVGVAVLVLVLVPSVAVDMHDRRSVYIFELLNLIQKCREID